MALDTKQKRGSVLGLTLPWRPWLSEPTTAFGTRERLSLSKLAAFRSNGFLEVPTDTAGSWVIAGIVTDDSSITADQVSRNNNASGAIGTGADEDTGGAVRPGLTPMSYSGLAANSLWTMGGFELRPVDMVQRLANANRVISDNLALGTEISIFLLSSGTLIIQCTELLGVTEQWQRHADAQRSISDDLAIATVAARSQLYVRLLSDLLGVTDQLVRLVDARRSLTELLACADDVSRLVDWRRAISEQLGVAATLLRHADAYRQVADNLGIHDDLGRSQWFARLVTDLMGFDAADITIKAISVSGARWYFRHYVVGRRG